MKAGRVTEVLHTLGEYREPDAVPDTNAPVRKCCRYIQNRPGQFNYPAALEADLPIGSGEIESAHRHVIQERLKITGAWWKPQTAKHMLGLRVVRANHEWKEHWSETEKQAA